MNEITRKRVDPGALFTGLILIAVGILFLLDRLDVANFGFIAHHYWPLIVVAFGVRHLLRGRTWNGLWFIVIGSWLQVSVLRLFGLTFGSSWPLLLIAYGAGMILRAMIDSARRREPTEPEDHHGA